MTEREFNQVLIEHWEDGWDTLHPPDPSDPDHVPYTYDNEIFESALRWVRLSVRHTVSKQTTMGSAPSRRFEREGFVMVQVFANVNVGRGELADLAADVRTVLEGKRFAGLVIHAGSTQETPSDGVWAMTVISLPFRYVELR